MVFKKLDSVWVGRLRVLQETSEQSMRAALEWLTRHFCQLTMAVSAFGFYQTRSAEHSCAENIETMDYLQEGDVGFKRRKARLLFYHPLTTL